MLKEAMLKSICKFLHPPTPVLAGLTADHAITNSFRLPDMEDLQLYVVWNSDALDFTESLIFKIIDQHHKIYICSLRRQADESVTALVKRTVETAIEKMQDETRLKPDGVVQCLRRWQATWGWKFRK